MGTVTPAFRAARAALLAALIALSAARGASAQVSVTATVDDDQISTDQVLTLTVTVEGTADVTPPDVEAIEGFRVAGSSSATHMSFGAGGPRAQSIFIYHLQPEATGNLIIGPLALEADGRPMATDAIPVRVVAGYRPTAQPFSPPAADGPLPVPGRGAEPYTLEAEIAPPRPYLGQRVTYIVRVFQWFETGSRARYRAPEFKGFWNASPDPERRQEIRNIDGRPARVTEFRTQLFPTTTGPLTIAPARLGVPNGFTRGRYEIESQAVDVTVRPLPEGAPEAFDGAVGQLSLALAPLPPQVRAGEPVSVELVVSGQGNIETLPEPRWPDLPAGWRWIPGNSTSQQEVKDGEVRGSRRFLRHAVAGQPGSAALPAFRYAYFDPLQERYQVAETAPQAMEVLPAAGGAILPAEPEAVDRPAAPAPFGAPARLSADPTLATTPLFKAAQAAYAAGDPAGAAAMLDRLLAGLGPDDQAATLLALGQAELARGEAGRGWARLRWERAQRLRPRLPELRGSLRSLSEAIEGPGSGSTGGWGDALRATLQTTRAALSDAELAWLLAAGVAMSLLAIAVRRARRLAPGTLTWLGALAVLGLGLVLGLRRWEDAARPRAIVVTAGAALTEVPGPPGAQTALETIAAGEPAYVLERREGFARVTLATGAEGWLDEADLAVVPDR